MNTAIEEERFREALRLNRKAQPLAPTSTLLITTEAFLLERLGNFKRALECYERAYKIRPEGETAFHLICALTVLRDPRAKTWLELALRSHPSMVMEAENEFAALIAQSPELQRAVRDAWRAIGPFDEPCI